MGWDQQDDPIDQPPVNIEPLMDGAVDLLVFGGMQLEVSSGGFYPAVAHGTVRPVGNCQERSDETKFSVTTSNASARTNRPDRISMPLFVRVRAEAETGCPAHKNEVSSVILNVLRDELARLDGSYKQGLADVGCRRLADTLAVTVAKRIEITCQKVCNGCIEIRLLILQTRIVMMLIRCSFNAIRSMLTASSNAYVRRWLSEEESEGNKNSGDDKAWFTGIDCCEMDASS